MNDDESEALQEENRQIAELAEAIEKAQSAGLDANKIMAEARQGYRSLEKLNYSHESLAEPIVGKTFLLKVGIYSERHVMIRALETQLRKQSERTPS